MNNTVALSRATKTDALVLSRLLDLYLDELSPLFDLKPDADGRFVYPFLDLYWQEPATRFAYVIEHDGEAAGFALVTRASPATSDPEDLDVAEFFVLPSFRRAAVGRRAAFALWDGLPGHWIVRVAEGNRGAEAFWERAVREYSSGLFGEAQHPGRSRMFRVFDFHSRSVKA